MVVSETIEMESHGKEQRAPEVEELEKISDGEPVTESTPTEPTDSEDEQKYPSSTNLALATLALMVAVFLIALDVHILGASVLLVYSCFQLNVNSHSDPKDYY
jgi:hypothetical protein